MGRNTDLESILALCPFSVLLVVGSPGSLELPSHVFLARLTVPGMFPLVE